MESDKYEGIKSIIHSDFLDKPAVTTINYSQRTGTMECPKCGELAEVDTSKVLTSIPPQYEWHCPHCLAYGSVRCDDQKLLDPTIWDRLSASCATHCEICGDGILIYGDEKPLVCEYCKEAVIAMRKALGTWHD